MATYVAPGGLKLSDLNGFRGTHRMTPLTPDMAKEAANGAPNFDRSVGLRPGDRVVSLGQNPTCLIVATG